MSPEQIDAGYEWETANVIIERFKGIDPTQVCAVLVHNHGPFVWGPSGRRAVENALALEIVAEMAPKTLLLNQGIAPIPQPSLDKHSLRKHGASAYYGQHVDGS